MDTRTIVEQYKKRNSVVQQIRQTRQVRIVGESMWPTLDPEKISVLFISNCSKYKIGDIVVFEYKHSFVGVSIHRIVKKYGGTITTKGDNNLQSDESINISAIIGKVEKALIDDTSIVPVKSSRCIAMLSRFENYISKLLARKIVWTFHQLLIKMYNFLAYEKGDNK